MNHPPICGTDYHAMVINKLLNAKPMKCQIYRTLIRPVVLYGHESWTIRAEDANALGVFERRILRTIFGGVFEHGAWRRRMNHELAELVRWTEHPDGGEGWQDTMAGACHEDTGLMPHQEGVRQRSPVRNKAQGSTANSMAGSGEAKPVGNRVSAWMGGCSQRPSILENCC